MMKYKLKVYAIQEVGQRKDAQGNPHQEDSIFPPCGHQNDSDRTFILCDGMGGHDAGEVASSTVCEAMASSVTDDGHDAQGIFTRSDFDNALAAAFAALDAKDHGETEKKKMGTTMTFLKLHDAGAFIAHIGDSRVYHIRPGKTGDDTAILFATEDHSLVNDLIKIGEMTHEEARQSKQKNVITRAMQPHIDRRPSADVHTTADIRPGDYFYLCSDGMLEQYDMESGETLCNIFSEMGGDDSNKVKILTKVTENNRDNHAAIIIHILDVEGRPELPAENPDTGNMAEVDDDPSGAVSARRNAAPAPAPAPAPPCIRDDAPRQTRRHGIGLFVMIAILLVALSSVTYLWLRSSYIAKDPAENTRSTDTVTNRNDEDADLHRRGADAQSPGLISAPQPGKTTSEPAHPTKPPVETAGSGTPSSPQKVDESKPTPGKAEDIKEALKAENTTTESEGIIKSDADSIADKLEKRIKKQQ